jgi:hypothetical protein
VGMTKNGIGPVCAKQGPFCDRNARVLEPPSGDDAVVLD